MPTPQRIATQARTCDVWGLDPGLRSPGLAHMWDMEIIEAIRLEGTAPSMPLALRCLTIATSVTRHVIPRTRRGMCLVWEWPQVYIREKSKGDPNDLPPLVGIGMATTAQLNGYDMLGEVVTPLPAEWSHQVSKSCAKCGELRKSCKVCRGSIWETPRGAWIWSVLSPKERLVVPDQSDAVDATGIALWRVGRLVRTLPGLVT